MSYQKQFRSMNVNELYQAAGRGDRRAEKQLFELLAARFHYLVRRKVMNPQDCEEIVQNALTTIAAAFRDIEITVSFSAWAHSILQSRLVDFYRKEGRYRDRFTSETETPSPGGWTPDPEFRRRLIACLKKLHRVNVRHAEILRLSYEGYEMDEICRRTGLSRTNIYTILSRARAALNRCLTGGDEQ